MSSRSGNLRLAVLALSLLAACAGADRDGGDRRGGSSAGVASAEATVPQGFLPARGRRDWRFPRDHGAHPEYGTEWWYTTGIVATPEGRRFGYELTFFRVGVVPRGEPLRLASASPWRARDVLVAHAALTDLRERRFRVGSRESRAAQGWAGADTSSLNVWIDDWRIQEEAGAFTLRVPSSAARDGFSLDLRLAGDGPVVLHGEGGLSPRDGRREPHSSWYASLPRLQTRGTITVLGQALQVTGTTWLDHEFFSGGLSREQAGWDWFSARLEDGRDLMLYRLRARDGTTSYVGGTVVAAGERSWRAADTRHAGFRPLQRWRSPATGAEYPVAWRVSLPAEGLELVTRTPLPEQEVRPGGPVFNYWEGVVSYQGTWGSAPVRGEGYVEMTGYARPIELP